MLQIRIATLVDLPEIGTVNEASARGLSGGFYSEAQIDAAVCWVFGVDTQLVADGTYYVAVDDGRIVGCGGWSRRSTLYGGDQMKTGEDRLLDPTCEPARIRAFFVHPDRARRGIARRILEQCVAAARTAGFGTLELAATLPGVPFYAAEGFETVERIDARLPNGVELPIVRMRRAI